MGLLSVGKYADFVILDRDILTLPRTRSGSARPCHVPGRPRRLRGEITAAAALTRLPSEVFGLAQTTDAR